MNLETLATNCFVQIAHGAARRTRDEGVDISIVDAGGKLLLGTTVHQTELPALVGPILAKEELDRFGRGAYVHNLRPVEVLAIRGHLLNRITDEL